MLWQSAPIPHNIQQATQEIRYPDVLSLISYPLNKAWQQKKPAGGTGRIPWHPAFVQAMRLELGPYKDVPEFTSEHQLASEPLKIGMVIVKKAPGVVIDKNIARIFKRVNIMEYKSPEE
jgi:hypothetical protein